MSDGGKEAMIVEAKVMFSGVATGEYLLASSTRSTSQIKVCTVGLIVGHSIC